MSSRDDSQVNMPDEPRPARLQIISRMDAHRQSFSDLRGLPPSPRSQRQVSFSQAAIQDLVDNPPVAKHGNNAFVGRDWRDILVGELVNEKDVSFVSLDTAVEAATELLLNSKAPVVLIQDAPNSKTAIDTFDYSDLNAYLLLVVGVIKPEEGRVSSFKDLANKAMELGEIPLRDIKDLDLGKKEPFVTLPRTVNLMKAVEMFGSGIHRILIIDEDTTHTTGILSQLDLVNFLWENGRSFPVIDRLYPHHLRDLAIGSMVVIGINGDRPLADALKLMHDEGVTSVAVIDNQHNVIGNISTVDVKLLTKASSEHLLRSTCIHFISVILSTRGMKDGKDSFPVFHVSHFSTLAHTVAKLVATKSHRMWIVDAPSPASSHPPTPVAQPAVLVPPPSLASHSPGTGTPSLAAAPSPSVSASAIPSGHLSGRLTGVISLTDILNLFARATGLNPDDPNETRKQRRRSSSSSLKSSLDAIRTSSTEVSRR